MRGCGQGVFDSGGNPLLSPGYPDLFFKESSPFLLNADLGTEQWLDILLLLFSAGDGEGGEQDNTLDSL